MIQELLDRQNLVTGLKQVFGEEMPECVTTDMFDHFGLGPLIQYLTPRGSIVFSPNYLVGGMIAQILLKK